MTLGPVVAAAGLMLIAQVDADSGHLAGALPGLIVLGLALALTVAPLTATELAAGGEEHAGISGVDYRSATDLTDGFRTGMLICAVLSLAGGLLALATIRRPEEPETARAEPLLSCPIGAPTLARTPAGAAARP